MLSLLFFFFNYTSPTEIYTLSDTLSLHDALPISTVFWRSVLDQGLETWAKLFAQTPATPELLPQWKQFIDQWIEAWSKVLGQAMGTEQFAKIMGRSLDQFLAT